MTMAYLHAGNAGELLVRLEGHVSRAENARALRSMAEDGAFRDLSRISMDVRDFTSTELTSTDMKWLVNEIARQLRRGSGVVSVSFCARGDSFGYAMARMFHSYASLSEVFRIEEIVTDCTPACAALAERIRHAGQVISA